jgi:hypothetical protein
VGHTARLGEKRNMCRDLVEKKRVNEKPSEIFKLKWEVILNWILMKEYWRAWTEFI